MVEGAKLPLRRSTVPGPEQILDDEVQPWRIQAEWAGGQEARADGVTVARVVDHHAAIEVDDEVMSDARYGEIAGELMVPVVEARAGR